MEIKLEDGVYQLRYNYILQDDEEEYDVGRAI